LQDSQVQEEDGNQDEDLPAELTVLGIFGKQKDPFEARFLDTDPSKFKYNEWLDRMEGLANDEAARDNEPSWLDSSG